MACNFVKCKCGRQGPACSLGFMNGLCRVCRETPKPTLIPPTS
jgi:hypothetical protein